MRKVEMWSWVVVIGILVSLIVGCEDSTSPSTSASTSSAVAISPTATSLNSGVVGTAAFTASGGSGTYTWALSDATLGVLTTNNATATYQNAMVVGTNTVTVTDSNGSAASATVTQIPAG